MKSNNTLNTVLRYAVYVLLAATLFTPLFVANSMFFPFITGKAYTFRILVEIAFAAWLALALFDKNARPKLSPLFVGVTLFTIVALIADLAGVNPIRSLWSNFERSEGWITIIHLWAYFVVLTSVLRTRIAWQRFFNVSFIAASAVALWAIIQYFHGVQAHTGTRLDASLGNAEYLAVYMLIHAFLALYMSIVSWTKRHVSGWLYLALFFVYSVVIFGTQTRGTILALGGAVALMLAIIAIKKDPAVSPAQQKSATTVRVVSAVILAVIILGSIGFYSVRHTAFVQTHAVLQRIASISLENPRIQYIWPMALKGFKEKPLIGWGQENFNYVFNKYYDPKMWGQEQWFDRAHNVFLDWLIAGGVLGFAFYVALFVLALIAVWKSRFSVMERAALTGLVVGYAIHNMFVFDNLASYLMFFITLGFLHTASTEGNTGEKTGEKIGILSTWSAKIAAVTVNPEVTEWVIAPILVILLAGSVYVFNIRPIQANLALIGGLTRCAYIGQTGAPTPDVSYFTKALNINTYVANQEIREQLYSCASQVLGAKTIPNDVKLAFYQATVATIADQAKATPNDLRGFLFGASFFDNIGQYSAATPYAERAYALSSVKQSVILELASNEMSLGSTTPALALLKKAYDEDPTYPEAKGAYARGLYLAGQYPQAIALFKDIVAGDPKNAQNHITLAIIYMAAKDTTDAIAELEIVGGLDIQYGPAVTAAIKDIKAGKNPFVATVSGAVAQ